MNGIQRAISHSNRQARGHYSSGPVRQSASLSSLYELGQQRGKKRRHGVGLVPVAVVGRSSGSGLLGGPSVAFPLVVCLVFLSPHQGETTTRRHPIPQPFLFLSDFLQPCFITISPGRRVRTGGTRRFEWCFFTTKERGNLRHADDHAGRRRLVQFGHAVYTRD